MDIDKYLKEKLNVPENWDKYDRMTHRYSFEDMQEIAADLVKKLTIPVVVKSFICDAEEKGGNRCETQCLGCDGFQRMNEAN